MTKIQITPWKYHSQLLSVRDGFYPPVSRAGAGAGEDLREEACSLVWVWKHRGNLPHAVEATALLTDAILHDDPSRNSTFSIRATYSLAFCRFVTGLVDSKLHGPKLSMYRKAMMLGVPASFVELRHEATHRDLPSLVVLRNASQRSLDWLWEFYWAKLDPGRDELDWSEEKPYDNAVEGDGEERDVDVDMDSLKKEISNILQPVAREKKRVWNAAAASSKGGVKRKTRSSAELGTAKMSYYVRRVTSICCRERLGSPTLAQILLDRAEEVMISKVKMSGKLLEVHLSSWDEFLKEICRGCKPFLTNLVEEMARVLVAPTSASQPDDETYLQNIVQWMDHILTSETWASFRKRYLILSYVEILCDESPPNAWVDQLRKILKEQPPSEGAETLGTVKNGSIHAEVNAGADIEMKDGDDKIRLNEDPQSDAAVLRDFGWDFGCRPNFKAIGAV